jgi:hypothetical protein
LVFNDILLLETLIVLFLIFYTVNTNLLVLLYTGGIYLVLLGLLLFINDVDIYVGFLWVIDLGVGLIFFIFILHFTSFLYQKSQFNLTNRYFFLIINLLLFYILYFYYLPLSNDSSCYKDLVKTWFFQITYTDYYNLYNSYEITELNLLRDSYFLLNSFEFFVVNFSLLFGLLSSIILYFMIHRVFNILNFSQIINIDILRNIDTNFFIRSQNFITQQNTHGVVKTWAKNK